MRGRKVKRVKVNVPLVEHQVVFTGQENGESYRKAWDGTTQTRQSFRQSLPSLTHDQMVAVVADKLRTIWVCEIEVPVQLEANKRRADLIANCQGYTVAFEIKGGWEQFTGELRTRPQKRAPAVALVNEFYYVLDEAVIIPKYRGEAILSRVPSDVGLIILTKDHELRIVKQAPRKESYT